MERSKAAGGIQIRDIRDGRVRDVVRGLLNRHDEANLASTFGHLMKTVASNDLATVDEILRTSELFSHLRIRQEFPRSSLPFEVHADLLIMPRAELRAAYIVHRAGQNANILAEALRALAQLNATIFNDNAEAQAGLSVPDYIAAFGHSLILARKLAFIFAHANKESRAWKMSSDILSSYGFDTNNYGMMALVDTIGFDFSYLGLKSNFDDYVSSEERAGLSNKIAYLSFYPVEIDQVSALKGLAASYQVSILDAVHYALCHRELGVFGPELRFDQVIEEAWVHLRELTLDYKRFFDPGNIECDFEAFRAAPAVLEHEGFRNLRIATQWLFDNADSQEARVRATNGFEADFFASVRSIRDLLPVDVHAFDALPAAFDPSTAGNLVRSSAVVRVVKRHADFSDLTRGEMANLMGHTTELDKLLSVASLRQSALSASDPLVKLFLQTLLRAQSPATRDSFQFKQAFQQLVVEEHEGDILAFLEDIKTKNTHIIDYFVSLLDETMLSQMPLLIRKADDVYETRARILEWFGEWTGDETSQQKAKQLRIDRKIAAVRGQINETRLNIDPLRFKQWIEATVLAEFSPLVRQDSLNLPTAIDRNRSISELRLAGHRDPALRAIAAVMECYREFCTNADFGIASYLGRRIRHGTLKGTLLDGLPNPNEYELSTPIHGQYNRWRKNFEESTDAIAAKLHFVGKGSSARAVISPEIDNKDKADLVLVCLRNIYEAAQTDQGVVRIPFIVEQFCWYIFEIELRAVQEAILESRAEFGSFALKNGTGDFNEVAFEKAVNIALSSQFATVASWFKKPPNISPVAEVGDVVSVVLREARAEYAEFEPKVHVRSGADLELSGLVYYHVYDALSIVIKNAAKHGSRPGRVWIEARTENHEGATLLHIEVGAAVKENDSPKRALERMKLAGKAGPANADVVEGLSGVRKLQKMKLDGAILDFQTSIPPSDDKSLIVSIAVILSGLGQ